MVLKVIRLRRRGLTRRCVPLPFAAPWLFAAPLPFAEPLPLPFPVAAAFETASGEALAPPVIPLVVPIFEKQARMMAGGSPASAYCGESPRSAVLMRGG